MQVVDANGNMFGYDHLEIIGADGKPKTTGGGGSGTVTSVGLSMPSAFSVANSPVTTSGTIAVTGAGVASQYIRGDGSLANFPTSTGGGASVSYYLNGSISQGTIGGVAYKEMNSVPVIGAGTDFTINADGYIAQFITDIGNPNKLLIPAGNWNFETYFSASSSGGSPRFYIELYKYNGTTFTLIASNSAAPENITGGTSIDLYFSALAVPATTLLATDRLAVRFYVIHSGRTITMHTENSHLSQIITTFSTGLTALNGLTSQVQYLAVGTSGTNFNISSATDTHTFNIPTASAVNRGALSSTDWNTFNGKQDTLVSGTNIKTINGSSVLGSGNLTISGGVTSVTGTAPISSSGGATPAISIANASTSTTGALTSTDWNTFNGKQATLVSGTSIKTINGSSVLGSGDLVVGGGGASGIHTMLLGGGSLFGGLETTNSVSVFNATTYTSQDQMLYFPYIPNNSFTATTFTFQVNNTTIGGLARLCIYSHNGINAPLNRLYQSTDISLATSGSKTISVSYSFVKGTVYWFGLQTNIFNSQITGMNSNGGVLPIGNIGTTQVAGWVQVSLTYASGAPATAAPNSFSSTIPLIRLK